MDTNQNDSQFGQGSQYDNSRGQNSDRNSESDNSTQQRASRNPATSDDDFLGGDNQSKSNPNNQNNPNEGYQKSMTPGGFNPNIGGDESEYETSAGEDGYDEESLAGNEESVNRRDSEETDRHDDETRYSSPSSRNSSEE